MTLETFILIAKIQMFCFAVAFLLCFVSVNKREPYIKILGVLLLASVMGDLLSSKVKVWFSINPNYGATIYYITVIPIISAIYYKALNNRHRIAFLSIGILYFLFGVLNALFFQRSAINSHTLVAQSIIIICYGLYYYYWLLKELPATQLQKLPMFWINSAFVGYHSANLFLFAFTSYLVHVQNDNLLIYWTIHNIIGIIEALVITVALLIDLQKIKNQTKSLSGN